MKKVGLSLLIAAVAAVVLASMAFAQGGGKGQGDGKGQDMFRAKLTELNGSGAKGVARLSLDGTELNTKINARGLSENFLHAQHIHGEDQAKNECPSLAADNNGDDLVSTSEGLPSYGPIRVSFTTSGDTTPASALALDRFPEANSGGAFKYNETFDIPEEVANNLGKLHIVQHGVDLNGNGVYDGPASDLDPSVPLEAELPATCGTINPH